MRLAPKKGQYSDIGPIADFDKDQSGRRYFVDTLNHRIWIEEEGEMKSTGKKGSGRGEFHYPSGILVFASRAYVVDSWNHRVQIFSLPEWNYVSEFGSHGRNLGQLFCPRSIDVLKSGKRAVIAIADTNNARVSLYTPGGECCGVIETLRPTFPVKVRWRDVETLEVGYEDGVVESMPTASL